MTASGAVGGAVGSERASETGESRRAWGSLASSENSARRPKTAATASSPSSAKLRYREGRRTAISASSTSRMGSGASGGAGRIKIDELCAGRPRVA